MHQDDSGMILLLVREPTCCFGEIGDVERHEHSTLAGRLAEQILVVKNL